jgi:hypothetical protein
MITAQELKHARAAVATGSRIAIQEALNVLKREGGRLTQQQLDEAKRLGYDITGIGVKS